MAAGLLNAAASPALDRILAIILRIGKKLGQHDEDFCTDTGHYIAVYQV